MAKKREEDQRKQQELQRQQAAAAAAAPTTPAQPTAAQANAAAEAERQRAQEAEAERQRAQAAEAERQRTQAAAAARTVSNELRPISNPGPRYPQAAQRAGAAGSGQVEFTVNTDGSVGNVRAVSTDAPRQYSRDFEREALAAVKRWRFQPVGEATTTRRTIAFQQEATRRRQRKSPA